jgi:plasmid stabilization system protein ParE
MFQLYIRVLASEDIQQIVDFYENKAPHITDKFLENLYSEFNVITEIPELFE